MSIETNKHLSRQLSAILIQQGATARQVDFFMRTRGLAGEYPKALRDKDFEVSPERVRQIVVPFDGPSGFVSRAIDAHSPETLRLIESLSELTKKIELYAPNSDDVIQEILLKETPPTGIRPSSVLRMADLLGVDHNLKISSWLSKSKYEDDGKTKLVRTCSGGKKEAVYSITPKGMPEFFESFLNYARKLCRGLGAISANHVASLYGMDNGTPISPHEAIAFLRPFAIHLGRHGGDEWFTFLNSPNDFVRKTAARLKAMGEISFYDIKIFHKKFNQSMYKDDEYVIPDEALKEALLAFGFEINDDRIQSIKDQIGGSNSKSLSPMQMKMIEIFKETLSKSGDQDKSSIRWSDFLRAALAAGVNESTAKVYMHRKGLFKLKNGSCRLAAAG